MIKLYDICNQKIPINLRGMLPQSSCPLGNASILPSLDEKSYLCSFRQFKNMARWINPKRYKFAPNVFTPTNINTIWFGKMDNNFFPMLRYDNKIGFSSVKINNHLVNKDFQYEDLRLFYWGNSMCASGTRLDSEHKNGKLLYRAYQVIGNIIDCSWTININIKYDSKCNELLSRQLLQKNWMAIPDKPNKLIYLVGQTNNNIVDISTNHIESFPHNNNIVIPHDIRGNTPLLKVDDNRYITLTHVCSEDGSKYYISYFLVINNDLEIEHISQKFRFDSPCFIEFSTSMFYQNNTNQQIIGITVCENDCFQYVYLFEKQKLLDFIYSNKTA